MLIRSESTAGDIDRGRRGSIRDWLRSEHIVGSGVGGAVVDRRVLDRFLDGLGIGEVGERVESLGREAGVIAEVAIVIKGASGGGGCGS